jgi:DNA polymerase
MTATMTICSLDYETRCRLDITKVGLDAYTSDPSFEVLMAAYRIDDGPIAHWEAYDRPLPAELRDALLDPHVHKSAFNAAFERVVTRRGLGLDTPIEGWRCAMVLAYLHGFTGGLAEVGEQLGLPADKQKLKTGKTLIRLFCHPQRITKANRHEWRDWNTDPERWDEFCDYCKQDVVAEEVIRDKLLPYPVPDDEWNFYCLDQLINDRGIPVDLDFVRNVKEMSQRRRNELLDLSTRITGLANANSVLQLLGWLQHHGYPYADIRRETVQKALGRVQELWGTDDHPAVQVLRYRLWAARTSSKKADAALLSVGPDGHIRHMYQFAGASRTGRFSGKGVQPQNLARTPKLFEHPPLLDCATNLIRRGDYDGIELLVDEPMMVFSGLMRSMFRTEDEFHVCDYASVESAGLAWLTDCKRLLDVFHNGRDPYRDFATLFYRISYDEVTPAQRNICKAPCLACGYGMGPGKIENGEKTGLLKYAEGMGIDLDPEVAKHAVQVYREGYKEIPQFWWDCQDAAFHVVKTKKSYIVGKVRFEWHKPYMVIRLPSGRRIYYYDPRIERRVVETGRKSREYVNGHCIGEVAETQTRTVFTCWGRNQKTTKWERIVVRASHFCENICQALCRDILKVGMQRVHQAGFKIVGHAHDEIITIARKNDNYYNWRRMRELMCQPIEWAPGFPLNASGWSGPYYRKA